MRTYGRTTLYANYTEKQLLAGTQEEKDAKIIDILENSIDIHKQNKLESEYLYDYLYNLQDILEKQKHTRPLLPHIKLGGRIFYRTSDVKDMIDKEFSKPINFF